LNPTEMAFDGAAEPAGNPPELGQERLTAFHRTANPTDPRLPGRCCKCRPAG